MPINTHLTWIEQADFTPGLWDISAPSQLLSTQQAFAVLQDYEPQAEGGLRAFYLGTAIVGDGGGDLVTSWVCTGIYARGNIPGAAKATGDDRFITASNPTGNKAHILRWNDSNNDTNWTSMFADGTGSSDSGTQSDFALFVDNSSNTWYLIVLRTGNAKAVYKVQNTGGAGSAAVVNNYQGPICVSQARVMYCNSGDIHYSDIGALTITNVSAQVLTVNPNEAEAIIGMISERAPADLLIGLQGAPWYEINGDIANSGTPVRAMGDDHHQRTHYQHAPRVPGGIAFIEPGGRIYVTDGNNFTSISEQIARFSVDTPATSGPGQLAFLNDYLFAPGGRVYDFRTKAWFTTSLMPASVFHCATGSGTVYFADSQVNAGGPNLAYLKIYEGGNANVKRVSSANFQTVPFSDKNGRNVRIREVQLFVKNYVASSFTVSIIDSKGNTVSSDTRSADATGRKMLSFLFPNIVDDYLSVAVTASADDGTSEAPTIERVRYGFGGNNLIGQGNVAE